MASAAVLAGGRARGFGDFGDRDRLLGNVNTSAECGGLEARLDHEL